MHRAHPNTLTSLYIKFTNLELVAGGDGMAAPMPSRCAPP